jgi:hypothetical protein
MHVSMQEDASCRAAVAWGHLMQEQCGSGRLRISAGAMRHQQAVLTCLTASGQTVLTTLQRSNPSLSAARKPWSVAYGGATPVHSLMN